MTRRFKPYRVSDCSSVSPVSSVVESYRSSSSLYLAAGAAGFDRPPPVCGRRLRIVCI